MSSKKRILIISSNVLFAEVITQSLSSHSGLELIHILPNMVTEETVTFPLDVLILDSADPKVDITPMVARILKGRLGTKVIGLNLEDNTIYIYRGEQRMAHGVEDLVEAIEEEGFRE